MTLSQFMHVKTYPRKISSLSSKKYGNTVDKIVKEAIRFRGSCNHVKVPQSVRLISGKPLEDLPKRLEKLLKDTGQNIMDTKHGGLKKRAVRFDAHVLLAAVYSYPVKIGKVKHDAMDDFFKDCIEFHQNQFGEIDSAVLHIDESYFHIHVYTIDANAKRLHPGFAAKEYKKIDTTYTGTYRSEMSKLQDLFFEQVSSHHDIARIGPARKRYTRDVYMSIKKNAEEQSANYLEQLEKTIKDKQVEADKKHKATELENQAQIQKLQQMIMALNQKYEHMQNNLSHWEAIQVENEFLKMELAKSQALVEQYQ